MKKYVYENATVYITEPNEQHLQNIRKATERFLKNLIAEGLLDDNKKRSNRRTGVAGSYARKRD